MLHQQQEDFVPASQSPIWHLVRTYYRQMGIKAWHDSAVPNYITTNPFIASRYAKIVQGFFADFSRSGKSYPSEDPFYIIELGAGAGRFGYGFLKHFFSDLEMSIRDNRKFVYVMTDICKANIDFWKHHPQLQAFIRQGVLDFAYLDVMSPETIELLISGRTLVAGAIKTPLAVIANYILDSLPHDLFEIRNGTLRARLIKCRMDPDADHIADLVHRTKIDYRVGDCAKDYYQNRNWNAVLNEYQKSENTLNFAIPVGGLTAIEKLSSLTTGPMFMLASDFGDSDLTSIRSLPKRKIARNGCYTARVNFHAISRYLDRVGGRFFSPGHLKSSLETVGLVMNIRRKKLKHLSHAFQTHIRDFGPDEFFMMKKIIGRNIDGLEFEQMIGALRMSCWDAKIFSGFAWALKANLDTLDPWQKKTAVQTLRNVDDMYFRCDNTADPAIVIIDLLLTMGDATAARALLRKNSVFLRQSEGGRRIVNRVRALAN
ncbi:SAM-dependent methyltransferase [Sneathiella marina]|uniref:SAM-dependent methyltransferase n=1 Tax=Sneathiella marina TaxID=2950108 RepID=A0ABY4W717_9PROT|nr:SAM-dependent methyltransferase [Sneathiella marina]USG62967.1 SAM-dependent methyltransferase [Sneathiella marina]